MVDPSIGALLNKVGNKYTLCIIVGKRARQLTAGAGKLIICSSEKNVTIAINEVYEDKVTGSKKINKKTTR